MSNLLINESPLQVLPTLATYIGLNEAIILQQIHYWLGNKKVGRVDEDGKKWIMNTIKEWQGNFPFWSEPTIKRLLKNLVADGLVLWTDKLNKRKDDRTRWYTINYEHLNTIDSPVERVSKLSESRKKSSMIARAKDQNDTLGKRSKRSPGEDQNDTQEDIILIPTLPENTTENTTDISPSAEKDELTQHFGKSESEPQSNGTHKPQKPLTEAEQAHYQTFGVLPGDEPPAAFDTIQEIRQAGWNVHKPDVEQGIAHYLEAVRQKNPNFAVPNNPSTRKDWYKQVEGHLMDYTPARLPEIYKLAIDKLAKANMAFSRPGSLTKTLPEVDQVQGVKSGKNYKDDLQWLAWGK